MIPEPANNNRSRRVLIPFIMAALVAVVVLFTMKPNDPHAFLSVAAGLITFVLVAAFMGGW